MGEKSSQFSRAVNFKETGKANSSKPEEVKASSIFQGKTATNFHQNNNSMNTKKAIPMNSDNSIKPFNQKSGIEKSLKPLPEKVNLIKQVFVETEPFKDAEF
jgi:hypothetical protein